ncbi:type II secretion system minor pseudopilin GspI [Polymorphobacter sp.]|uniref:type II secretion system minor pseudopilin GspI n=1 Tax=Polymorphobacter sp. TaxID=1909290 RepID=UPI003F6F0AEF
MRAEAAERGFTLLEVLVALAVFSLAALALLRLQGASLSTVARLDDKLLAAIVVQNLAVETQLMRPAPAFGRSDGEAVNAGRRWLWQREVMRTPDPGLQRIELRVSGTDGSRLAEATLVRRAS